jgi:15-cis-phytoene synthase
MPGPAQHMSTSQPVELAPANLAFAYNHCEAQVREADHDRWLATLFAPFEARPALFALYAFSLEIARLREIVSEALPGEVRLQWWRDVLAGEARGDAANHPVAAALLDTIVRHRLPREPFTALVEARVFDLYDDPMPTLNDLEGYAAETSSALIRLACLILADGAEPGAADAAGHAGVAYAFTGLMRAFPWHAAHGQLYLPLELLARYGATRDDVVMGRGGPGVKSALTDLRCVARQHLTATRALRGTITPKIAPAFLPVALVEGYLRQMERRDYQPLKTVVTLPQWRLQWSLWRAARKAARQG